jgi:hypothetical protein
LQNGGPRQEIYGHKSTQRNAKRAGDLIARSMGDAARREKGSGGLGSNAKPAIVNAGKQTTLVMRDPFYDRVESQSAVAN